MNRLALMVLKNTFRLPYLYGKLCHYAKAPDRYTSEEMYAHVQRIIQCANCAANVTIDVYGTENLPTEPGFLLYANHQGMFDSLAILPSCKFPTGAVYKKELADIPLLKQVAACTYSFAMDRENVRQSLEVIQNVTKQVLNGKNYLIFPEGTRSKNGNNMGEFHHGSFRCALKAKCPVVPVALIDCFKVLDEKGSKPLTVQVHFLPPIMPEEYEGMKTAQLAALVKSRIADTISANI